MNALARWLAVTAALVVGSMAPVRAQTIELDSATIADLNAAVDRGTLTAEQLATRYLTRIEAYDQRGPELHAVITLNPTALETARALDAERKKTGRRSSLHGIPIVLKDNYDTADMPTTGASVLLEGSLPPDDAFVVRRLREAGAIILGKVNLSEFASGDALSFDTGGPMARHVYDVAVALSVMAGVDPADEATRQEGRGPRAGRLHNQEEVLPQQMVESRPGRHLPCCRPMRRRDSSTATSTTRRSWAVSWHCATDGPR